MQKALKWVVLIAVAIFLLQQLSFRGVEMRFVVPIVILIFSFILIKRWVPFLFTVMKGITLWSAKTLAAILWQKPERKGGAAVRSQKMRWRE